MKNPLSCFIFFILIACSSSISERRENPPNILLIISDDQAWNDYGFMGHPHIETPGLDQLAEESLTFTRGYVSAPLCSPSLATIITGLYPHQHGITGNDPLFKFDGQPYSKEWWIERGKLFTDFQNKFYKNTLLTQWLSDLNYLSLQTGKWWLGSWQDGHFTHGMTHGDYTASGRHGDEGLSIGRKGLQKIYSFIEEARSKKQPFFIWYAPFLPHTPHTPPKELEDKYLSKAPSPAIARYWAMCEWFDQTCQDLIQYLDRESLSKNTLVIYVCDNGWIQQPDQANRYAPRSKRSPYEGGIRTPLMFRWLGKIKPEIDTSTLVGSIDIVPTILAAIKQESDTNLPGVNILDRLKRNQRELLFAEAFDHDMPNIDAPEEGLKYRIGINYPWKLILPDTSNLPAGEMELFNIEDDPFETINQVDNEPKIARNLESKINEWWLPR